MSWAAVAGYHVLEVARFLQAFRYRLTVLSRGAGAAALGAWWDVGGVDREEVAARDGARWSHGCPGGGRSRGRLTADVVPGGAVVMNLLNPPLPVLFSE